MNRSHLLLLGLILAFAAALRISNLSLLGFWTDELCTLSEAHGRGLQLLDVPTDQVVPSRPVCTRLADARPVWAIPAALARDDRHPPLYLLLLRGWEAMFGDGETAVRSLNVGFSLAAIALLFVAARPDVGSTAALWACLVMAVATPQVQFAQEARDYMPVLAFSLAAVVALRRATVWLGAWLLAMMLTHYYAAVVAVAFGVTAVGWCRRKEPRTEGTPAVSGAVERAAASPAGCGSTLRARLLSFVGASAAFALLWGWGVCRQLPLLRSTNDMAWLRDPVPGHRWRTWVSLCQLPVRWVADVGTPPVAAGALFLVLPWLAWRRPPLRLWVLWLVLPTALVVVTDLSQGTVQLRLLRYTLFATPAAYVLMAGAVRGRLAWVVPAAATVGGLVALPSAWVPGWKIDLRTPVQQAMSAGLRPDEDGLVISGPDGVFDRVMFAAFQHYLPHMPATAAVLTRPAAAAVLDRLRPCRRVWVVWLWPDGRPITAFVPGYRTEDAGPMPPAGQIAVGRVITPAH